jgi:hypothetical protein
MNNVPRSFECEERKAIGMPPADEGKQFECHQRMKEINLNATSGS